MIRIYIIFLTAFVFSILMGYFSTKYSYLVGWLKWVNIPVIVLAVVLGIILILKIIQEIQKIVLKHASKKTKIKSEDKNGKDKDQDEED